MAHIDDFSIGTVLSQSWSIFTKNIVAFGVTSIALLAVPTIALFALVMPGLLGNLASDPLAMAQSGMIWKMQIPGLVQILLQIVLMSAICYGTYMAIDDKPFSFGGLISRGISGILPLLGISVISILVMIPSAFLLMVPFIIIMCIWWVAVPVAVVEKPGVIGSLKRSADLTKGARMKIFGLMLIYILFSFVVGIISLLFLAGGFNMTSLMQNSMQMMTGGISLYLVVSQILGALVFAFICVVIAVCYAELRRLKDGVDIKDIAHIFG